MAKSSKLSLNRMLKKYNFKGSKQLQKAAYNAAVKKAKKLQAQALQELDQHVVTKEIEAGPNASGSSLLGGVGSLFGFLGFDAGADPIVILRNSLQDFVKVQRGNGKLLKVDKTRFLIEFPIDVPTVQQIYSVTPLSWTTKSWVKGIERGITNATNTIFKKSENSRSGVAIQSSQNIGFVKFSPTPYITPILKKLRQQLK
mgnify:FL=1|tara:strand:- start:162 stop:761 length:600 start_codon:yes stop_codon:yes gene_type:complete